MRRADRLFRLVQLLRVRRTATGDQLARELGVSTRTVYRDIRDLEQSGVPIRGEAGVGYRLDGGYELPPLTFTSQEVEGLVLGARMVRAWGDTELGEAVASAMTKIEAAIPRTMRQVLLGTAMFAPDFHRAEELSHELATMRRAIGDRRRLRFPYVREDGVRSERTVRPLALYFWGAKWTLAAWCELRTAYRSFRPDRMGAVALLESRFEIDDEVSLARYLEQVKTEEARPPLAASA